MADLLVQQLKDNIAVALQQQNCKRYNERSSTFALLYRQHSLLMNGLQSDTASAMRAGAHRRRCLIRLIVLLVIFLAFQCAPAWAASKDNARKILSMPIFFVTDREKMPDRGDHQDFGVQMIEPIDSLYYGCQQVNVKLTDKEAQEVDNLPTWGWSMRGEKEPVTADPGEFKSQIFDKENDFQSLVAAVRKAMELNNRKELILFVHGCCINFEGSMNQAAALEEATRIPVINYAWGAVKGNYGGSSMTLPRSQERFNSLVRRLLKEFPDEKITLAGNSVGNMMIVEYCLETCEHIDTRKFDNIILSRADMDAFAFKTQVQHVVRQAKHVSLYVAKNDPQINLSGVLRWFFNPKDGSERVGNTRSAPMFNSDQPIVVYDVSALKLKHIMPHRAVAELLNNNGIAPQDSPVYVYTTEKDNVVRIVQRAGKEAERRFAHAAGE